MTRSAKFKNKTKIKPEGMPVGRAVGGCEQTVVMPGSTGPVVVAM